MTDATKLVFNFAPPVERKEPLTINGRDFGLVDYVDGLRLLTFTGTMRDPAADDGARSRAITGWLKDAIDDADWDDFQKVCMELALGIEELAEIAGLLADRYAEVPTRQAESSSTGPGQDGDSSGESSSSED